MSFWLKFREKIERPKKSVAVIRTNTCIQFKEKNIMQLFCTLENDVHSFLPDFLVYAWLKSVQG